MGDRAFVDGSPIFKWVAVNEGEIGNQISSPGDGHKSNTPNCGSCFSSLKVMIWHHIDIKQLM